MGCSSSEQPNKGLHLTASSSARASLRFRQKVNPGVRCVATFNLRPLGPIASTPPPPPPLPSLPPPLPLLSLSPPPPLPPPSPPLLPRPFLLLRPLPLPPRLAFSLLPLEHPDTRLYPSKFVHAMVTRENVNDLLRTANVPADVDLMSIDIDGNDYWVWDAIDAITPKVVIIETHIEFGSRSIVVPYDKTYVYPGKHPDYHGASPTAMKKLANKKGYRLVGSNDYGFNTIYVRRGLVEDALPEVPVETVLVHARNSERAACFEAIKDWEYVEIP